MDRLCGSKAGPSCREGGPIKLEHALSVQYMLATEHLCSRTVELIPSPSRARCKYESEKLKGLVSKAEIGRLLSNTQMTRGALALRRRFPSRERS